jgi:hypothetical protein
MPRREPSLADWLADDEGNFSREAMALLAGARMPRPRRRRNPRPRPAAPRRRGRRRWFAFIVAALFLIIVIKALSGASGKASHTALASSNSKNANWQIKNRDGFNEKPAAESRQPDKPKPAKADVPASQNAAQDSTPGISRTYKRIQEIREAMASVPPAKISSRKKITLDDAPPAIAKQAVKSIIRTPESLGYNFYIKRTAERTEPAIRKNDRKKRSRPSAEFRVLKPGVEGPG